MLSPSYICTGVSVHFTIVPGEVSLLIFVIFLRFVILTLIMLNRTHVNESNFNIYENFMVIQLRDEYILYTLYGMVTFKYNINVQLKMKKEFFLKHIKSVQTLGPKMHLKSVHIFVYTAFTQKLLILQDHAYGSKKSKKNC